MARYQTKVQLALVQLGVHLTNLLNALIYLLLSRLQPLVVKFLDETAEVHQVTVSHIACLQGACPKW